MFVCLSIKMFIKSSIPSSINKGRQGATEPPAGQKLLENSRRDSGWPAGSRDRAFRKGDGTLPSPPKRTHLKTKLRWESRSIHELANEVSRGTPGGS